MSFLESLLKHPGNPCLHVSMTDQSETYFHQSVNSFTDIHVVIVDHKRSFSGRKPPLSSTLSGRTRCVELCEVHETSGGLFLLHFQHVIHI